MATPRKVYATEDSYHLEKAASMNQRACEIIRAIAPLVGPDRRLAGPMLELSALIGEQTAHLHAMETIRLQAKHQRRSPDAPTDHHETQ